MFGKIDILDDVFGLDEPEIIGRNEVCARLLCDLKLKDSLPKQKARAEWIREGDVNTIFFHKVINRRRKRIEIVGGFNQ